MWSVLHEKYCWVWGRGLKLRSDESLMASGMAGRAWDFARYLCRVGAPRVIWSKYFNHMSNSVTMAVIVFPSCRRFSTDTRSLSIAFKLWPHLSWGFSRCASIPNQCWKLVLYQTSSIETCHTWSSTFSLDWGDDYFDSTAGVTRMF